MEGNNLVPHGREPAVRVHLGLFVDLHCRAVNCEGDVRVLAPARRNLTQVLGFVHMDVEAPGGQELRFHQHVAMAAASVAAEQFHQPFLLQIGVIHFVHQVYQGDLGLAYQVVRAHILIPSFHDEVVDPVLLIHPHGDLLLLKVRRFPAVDNRLAGFLILLANLKLEVWVLFAQKVRVFKPPAFIERHEKHAHFRRLVADLHLQVHLEYVALGIRRCEGELFKLGCV
mmetsp:Transcript_10403/g.29725  ORF Transcript_10403/g.29725 Transcript_10403/m.29725 type:complete len:227 (+) Transcript_10403:1635-2315(+)